MKCTSLPTAVAKMESRCREVVNRAFAKIGLLLLLFYIPSFPGQAAMVCNPCGQLSTHVSTDVTGGRVTDPISTQLVTRAPPKPAGLAASARKPRITSPAHDQIFIDEDVRLTVDLGIKGNRCDHGRFELVWLQARVDTENPFAIAWTLWSEGPTQIACDDPSVITLPSKMFGDTNALYIVNVRHVSDHFKGPWSGGRLFRWLTESNLTLENCRPGM